MNEYIKAVVFGANNGDTSLTPQHLVNNLYNHYKDFKMNFNTTYNKNGFLSITITSISSGNELQPPIYLNFMPGTGMPIFLRDLINTKNDSISFRQGVIPQITDSVRLFELSLDRTNPKYGEIIEALNNSLGNFLSNYTATFSLTNDELIVYYDCNLPNNLMHYNHRYKAAFRYKTLRNVIKPNFINLLLN